ncbi:carboxylesterase family protein [Streptomyces sp. AcE210]|uniref:carboxylesterase/lipase family protein n=1 Tax=Streptomyces sp. AcE210 TaxID=2292703 RepID=UPI001F0C8F62|nr:carboxylesterase family protein [Streptomyces sp. AcE210]
MTNHPAEQPVVRTAHGPVRGERRKSGVRFLGIPYAQPPVGELRFAAPVPPEPWSDILDATAYGPTAQRRPLAEVTFIPEPSIPGDATLNLNVFTPDPSPDAGLPVMVWIHGGGFLAGSQASPWYDGAAFNRDGVVVVSIGYRLGFDGFGWISDAPHNRAVRDWLLALEWVRDNIRRFGGDPDRVTIAGQSAGGAAVLTLLGMPRAQHLFQRVHCLSGPVSQVSTAGAERVGRKLAELGGVQPTRTGLSRLGEEQILDLQKRVSSLAEDTDTDTDTSTSADLDPAPEDALAGLAGLISRSLPFAPMVDGDLIPQAILDALAAGVGADKELVLGATDHEFTMALHPMRDSLATAAPARILAGCGVDEAVATAYVADHPDLDTADLVGQYVTDHVFRTAVARVARARGTAPTWLYRFAWRSPVLGLATHCLDVPFHFDCLDTEGVTAVAGAEPPEALAADVHGAAVAFIREGRPGWRPWTSSAPVTRVFDSRSSDTGDGYADVSALLTAPAPKPDNARLK